MEVTDNCRQNSIKILNVSGNNLNSLQPFEPCLLLVKVNASKNKLDDLEEVVDVVKRWPHILKLDLTGNPIASKNKYRDKIILATMDSIGRYSRSTKINQYNAIQLVFCYLVRYFRWKRGIDAFKKVP